jgi:hypothetical protein
VCGLAMNARLSSLSVRPESVFLKSIFKGDERGLKGSDNRQH